MRTKIEYILDAPAKRPLPETRLGFTPIKHDKEYHLFRWAIREMLTGSLDRADQAALHTHQGDAHAQRLSEPDRSFLSDPLWWALARERKGALVGIVQPVLFAGCERDGLQEGTFHYIGVLPAFRGRGYINDLLRFGTWQLAEIGVWRIYTDTDELNAPMRRAFQANGYREGRPRLIPDGL